MSEFLTKVTDNVSIHVRRPLSRATIRLTTRISTTSRGLKIIIMTLGKHVDLVGQLLNPSRHSVRSRRSNKRGRVGVDC